MWIPKTEEEIVNAITSGSVEETAIFDVKKELPAKKDNKEIAKDVAAMANDGGVIIYGIDEDEHGRPTILNPIPLAGQRERVDSIVRTSIAEPPTIHIHAVPTATDASKGYLVVVVPPSERAPHMVAVKSEHRYYGRTDTGNKPLNEAEVARLYRRRQQWEVDHEALLAQEIARAPLSPKNDHGFLHLIAQPVFRSEELLGQAASAYSSIPQLLDDLVNSVLSPSLFPRRIYAPDFEPPTQPWQYRVEGFQGEIPNPFRFNNPYYTLDIQVDFDGAGHLFCGRAAEPVEDSDFLLFASLVAGNTTRFIALLGELYDKARYVGMVDIGLAITGVKGAVLHVADETTLMRSSYTKYDRGNYTRTIRIAAPTFKLDPREIAQKLLMPLFNAMSQGRINPFHLNPRTQDRTNLW